MHLWCVHCGYFQFNLYQYTCVTLWLTKQERLNHRMYVGLNSHFATLKIIGVDLQAIVIAGMCFYVGTFEHYETRRYDGVIWIALFSRRFVDRLRKPYPACLATISTMVARSSVLACSCVMSLAAAA